MIYWLSKLPPPSFVRSSARAFDQWLNHRSTRVCWHVSAADFFELSFTFVAVYWLELSYVGFCALPCSHFKRRYVLATMSILPTVYPPHFPVRAMSHNEFFNEIAGKVIQLLTSHEGNWWMDKHYKECNRNWECLLRCSAHRERSFMRVVWNCLAPERFIQVHERLCRCTWLGSAAVVEENVG